MKTVCIESTGGIGIGGAVEANCSPGPNRPESYWSGEPNGAGPPGGSRTADITGVAGPDRDGSGSVRPAASVRSEIRAARASGHTAISSGDHAPPPAAFCVIATIPAALGRCSGFFAMQRSTRSRRCGSTVFSPLTSGSS